MTTDQLRGWKRRFLPLLSKKRFGKFVSVGVLGAVLDTTVLVFLVEVVGLVEEAAVLVGIESAILFMFALNDNWTYANEAENDTDSVVRRLITSHAVRSGGIVTQFVTFIVIYRIFSVSLTVSGFDLWLLVAKGAGISLGMVVNYTFETLFTWSVS